LGVVDDLDGVDGVPWVLVDIYEIFYPGKAELKIY
jgi:hypothetical protein